MFEDISKNWGYLTTFGAIVGAIFWAGIWLKTSLDTLEKLPETVGSIDRRLKSLEDISESIEQATCALAAKTEMAKNEVKKFTIDLKIEEIREQVSPYTSMDSMNEKQQRKYDALQVTEREFRLQGREFQSNYDKSFQIYDDCK